MRRLEEDFNFIMEKGAIRHLEFESDSIKEEDLRRFRSYEAVTAYICHVDITTYVICSSTVKEILSELKTGHNTYRIIPIRLKDKDADELLARLFEKQKSGETLERSDLVPLLLTTLMSGTTNQKDRIIMANQLITKSGAISETDLKKMQAVLYTLANKFLSKDDLNQVKEVLFMTPLGQMLVKDGFEKGIERGAGALISICRETGFSYDDTRKKLIEKLELDSPAAVRYMEEFWSRPPV